MYREIENIDGHIIDMELQKISDSVIYLQKTLAKYRIAQAETTSGIRISPTSETVVQSVHSAPSAIPVVNLTNTAEVDSKGQTWNPELHSSSRAKNADGSWKARRGSKGKEVSQPASSIAPPVISIPAAPTPTIAVEMPFTPQAAPVVQAAPVPAPLPQVVPNTHNAQTFKTNLFMIIATLIKEGKITQDYVNQLLTHFAVGSLQELLVKGTDEQINSLFELFVQYGLVARAI